jgi:hypothetical protein
MIARIASWAMVLFLATVPRAFAESLLELLDRNATDQIAESQRSRFELQLVFAAFRDAACGGVDFPQDAVPDVAALTKYFLQDGVEAALVFSSGLYVGQPLYQDALRLAAGSGCKTPRSQRIYVNLYRLLARRASDREREQGASRGVAPSAVASGPVLKASPRLPKPNRTKYVEPVFDSTELGASSRITAVFEIVVATNGKVEAVYDRNQSSVVPRSLSAAAQRAVEAWEYEPTIVDGRPVRMQFFVSVVMKRD